MRRSKHKSFVAALIVSVVVAVGGLFSAPTANAVAPPPPALHYECQGPLGWIGAIIGGADEIADFLTGWIPILKFLDDTIVHPLVWTPLLSLFGCKPA